MADLRTSRQTNHQAVDAFLTAARTVPAVQWGKARAPGKWSPAQVAEHLALTYEINRGVLHGTAPSFRVAGRRKCSDRVRRRRADGVARTAAGRRQCL